MNGNEASVITDGAEAELAELVALDVLLDLALADTFPASDPPALLRRSSMDRADRVELGSA